MKEWFKYEFGYVNLDQDNLFLTNSGNWTETHGMAEKDGQSSHKPNIRKVGMKFYFFACMLIFALLIFMSFIKGTLGLGLLILAPAGIYYLYHYLRTEIGPRFRIPLKKINAMNITGSQVEIRFMNLQNGEDMVLLKNVEEKGLQLIKMLTNIHGIVSDSENVNPASTD